MEYCYEEFVEELRQLLLAMTKYGEERIYFKHEQEDDDPVERGDRLYMVCGTYEGRQEVCGLHTRELYEQYLDGVPMEILLKEILEQLTSMKENGIFGRSLDFDDYGKVKDSLCIRLLNRRRNAWDLKDAVYKTVGDIVVVLYMNIGEWSGVLTTMKIRKSMLESWKVDKETAFEVAILNSFRQAPPRIYAWRKWIANPTYRGEAFMDLVKEYPFNKGPAGNCLSTSKKTNGAAAIFYPGVADRIAELLDDNFFLVFTSIHEVMIHAEGSADLEFLRHALRTTVKRATPDEDFLTYKVYRYDRDERKFSIAI